MPLQSNDIATQMGDLIASNMGDTALTFRNNAPNDKTFVVTILGVGQNFTEDITQAEQESIIKKHDISSNMVDGDPVYYTFKLEGIYYTLRQNGDFKLYEQVLLRVPNNNWDRMILERIGGNQSGNTYKERNVYVDTIEPPIAGKNYAPPQSVTSVVYEYWFQVKEFMNSNPVEPRVMIDSVYMLGDGNYQKLYCVCSDEKPTIDNKYIASIGGEYYWIKADYSGNNVHLIQMYKVQRDINAAGLVQYLWDENKPMWQIINPSQDGVFLSNEYNSYPIRTYVSIPNNPTAVYPIYISFLPPMNRDDYWIEIKSRSSKIMNRLLQYCDVSDSGVIKEWREVADNNSLGIIVSEDNAGTFYNGEFWVQMITQSATDATLSGVSEIVKGWKYFKISNEWLELKFGTWGSSPMYSDTYYPEVDDGQLIAIYKNMLYHDAWDEAYLDEIYPEDEGGNKSAAIMLNVPPNTDGMLWAKVDSLTTKRVLSISQYIYGKWVFKYNVEMRLPAIISYPLEPTLPDELYKDDYYVYYEETYDNQNQIVKTFKNAFKYSDGWTEIEAECGTLLPDVGVVDTYYIVVNNDWTSATIYFCESGDEETVWVSVDVNEIYLKPYPVFFENDYWAKLNNIKNKKLMSFYQRIQNTWKLLYNAYTPTIYSEVSDPSTKTDENQELIYNVQPGDYWAQITDERTQNLTAFYERKTVIVNEVSRDVWELLYHARSGNSLVVNVSNAILINTKTSEENQNGV